MYFVLMLPRFVPLGLEPKTLKECKRAVDWQVVGGNKSEGFPIVRLVKGQLIDVKTGEIHTPFNGIYTQEAWARFEATLEASK